MAYCWKADGCSNQRSFQKTDQPDQFQSVAHLVALKLVYTLNKGPRRIGEAQSRILYVRSSIHPISRGCKMPAVQYAVTRGRKDLPCLDKSDASGTAVVCGSVTGGSTPAPSTPSSTPGNRASFCDCFVVRLGKRRASLFVCWLSGLLRLDSEDDTILLSDFDFASCMTYCYSNFFTRNTSSC